MKELLRKENVGGISYLTTINFFQNSSWHIWYTIATLGHFSKLDIWKPSKRFFALGLKAEQTIATFTSCEQLSLLQEHTLVSTFRKYYLKTLVIFKISREKPVFKEQMHKNTYEQKPGTN